MGNEGKNTILIKSGRVIDPANNLDEILDIFVEGGRVSQVSKNIEADAEKIIDAKNRIVMPGIVDMHVHLREPGREDKETVLTGTKAALKGGVTSLLAMPNTMPCPDNIENARLIKGIVENSACANVFISGAITVGRFGRELADIPSLRKEGITAFTDDGASVESEELMSEGFQRARKEKALLICHCEDKALSNNGVVNLGFTSTRLGLRGISNESEYKRIARDIELAKKAGASLHIAHVSCKESVEMIAQAKKEGIKLTCETAPHYFSLSEEAVLGYDTNMKINPPLRSKEDVLAIRKGLADGTIDAIASDHAPHTENEKEIEFDRAEFGSIGLETELAVSITELIQPGLLDWMSLVRKLSLNPSSILGIDKGTLGVGSCADIIVVFPEDEWVASKKNFVSKSKNSCFLGKKLKGVVEYTILSGKIVYRKELPR